MNEILELLDRLNRKISMMPNGEDIRDEFNKLGNQVDALGEQVFNLTKAVNTLMQANNVQMSNHNAPATKSVSVRLADAIDGIYDPSGNPFEDEPKTR